MERIDHVTASASRRTRITLGVGALDTLPEPLLDAGDVRSVVVVTDENVAATPWPDRVARVLEAAGFRVHRTVVAAGEWHKTMAGVEDAWADWATAGLTRDAVVVAVGGGCLSDLAGFAAATYLRGLRWVVVPTTLLAMADASLGGKTAVNRPEGKNRVGAFHDPVAVVADLDTLATVPAEVRSDGWAEILKAAVIGDGELFERLEGPGAEQDVEAVLARAVRVKLDVVGADPREAARREILNFGHTVGHALEHVTSHALTHGQAVAIGLVAEARLAVELGRLPATAPERVAAACERHGLPSAAPAGLDDAALRRALGADKKRRPGGLRVALPDGLGRHGPDPSVPVEPERLLAALAAR